MELNIQKEEFSYAYIHAVASAAGYTFERAPQPLDRVGVDVIITSPDKVGSMSIPQLHLQVKSTSIKTLTEDTLRYPLKVKNYEELRDESRLIPLILVVVLVPETVDKWLTESEEKLSLNCCGYWMSCKGKPATKNIETVTVQIPRKNKFYAKAVKNIMERISRGEDL